ncbi:MAG: hypothetical protein ABDI19_04000 [Armatimonadota bacterium]
MPKLTIEISEHEWELLEQAAQRQQITPELLVQQLIRVSLQCRSLRSKRGMDVEAHRAVHELPQLPRGSLLRVMSTLDLLQSLFPSDKPPPSREEIDAYLQAERDLWDKTVKE